MEGGSKGTIATKKKRLPLTIDEHKRVFDFPCRIRRGKAIGVTRKKHTHFDTDNGLV